MATTDSRRDLLQTEELSNLDANWMDSDISLKEPAAIGYFRGQLLAGKDWCRAMLETIGMWILPEESHDGRHYRYMIGGEAFDWLLLAERLCSSVDCAIPSEERKKLLFHGRLPENMSWREFNSLIGFSKYRAYLNYWYGVVVEDALQLAVESEVRKRHRAKGYSDSEDLVEKAFVEIYDETRTNLLRSYMKQTGCSLRSPLTLTLLKEFTYWLFKKRIRYWDPARVASDTRKGLEQLNRLRSFDSVC